ncbi:MAG: hypothetical protein H7Y07_06805 [Pyrinomonadaceae bacterium]|nr:hypothetical protein [Sphingobacteriaceae bacterium]
MYNLFKSRFRNFVTTFCLIIVFSVAAQAQETRKLTFDGVLSEQKLTLKELSSSLPSDWSGYTHLVMDVRTSSPQRFSIWLYRTDGIPIRLMFQPFGQNVWFRASIPLQYFKGMDKSGNDLASSINRRTNSFWMSVWGPFGEINAIEAVGFAMTYPINKPTVELRGIHLSKQDEGSEFLEKLPVLNEFNQWAAGDWPGKIKNRAQLDKELADEAKKFGNNADFNYCDLGGYKNTQAKATGFFRVEQVDGKWWFVDPHGHLFLSTGVNGITGGGGQTAGATPAAATTANAAPSVNIAVALTKSRLESWGMTTGGQGRANILMLRWPQNRESTFLGLPDVYAEEFAKNVDLSANTQCSARKDDPLLLGYFIGNEPPWDGRESEVTDMILSGPKTATQTRLKEFLGQADNPKLRKQFVLNAFVKYLDIVCTAVKKYDPNHLNLGIRFGGPPSDEVLRTGRVFDVCSVNIYEYDPTKLVDKVYRLTGRPILIGEFHIGVPANGLGAGLVQAKDQAERGVGYRYYVEQAASLPGFLGAHWFTWRDEPVLGRGDGENYNIGLVDVTDRPYKELVEAAKATNKRLLDVHSGKIPPFNLRAKASEAGAPVSPWGY